jgi:hypothetical protein
MSTKINVRSPFYLHLDEPTVPLPFYDCNVANLTGFSIDNQGVITLPTPSRGSIYSYTSTDPDFANNKFAVETNDTERTVLFSLNIPAGLYSNSSDLYYVCGLTTIQAGTGGTAAPCTPSVTTSGSIPSQTIDIDGDTVDIDLSGYFTGETTYAVSNNDPLLTTTALSGSTLTITSNAIGGSTTIYALGRDASYPTTCEAVQPISVTVDAAVAFSCTPSPLSGGSIAADGTITRPQSSAIIQGVSLTNGGALLSPEEVSPNTGSSSQPVDLFFKLLVPPGYTNSGNSIYCPKTLSQAGTDPLIFDCDLASLTGQKIAKDGSISLGSAALGATVNSFTPPNPPLSTVTTNTTRTITFQVEIPSGYADAGTEIDCDKELIQPATTSICGSNNFFLSVGKSDPCDFCDATYSTSTAITSTASSITGLMGSQICRSGNAFNGKSLYYAVATSNTEQAGVGVGDYYAVQIDSAGIVLSVEIANCQAGCLTGNAIIL